MIYKDYNVPRGTIEKYIELLLSWNKQINLVSISDQAELVERYILDSLQLKNYLKDDEIIYDIGSGAGFPGLMLSYAGIKEVNLVEKINKKANFLIAASGLSKNKITVHNIAIEDLSAKKCDVITARGFASLENILQTTNHFINENTRYLLLKGKNIDNEIKKALENWSFEYILYKSKTSEDGCIIELKKVQKNGKRS